MNDNELTLYDRLEVIKLVNKQHDLENNAYISFSGGKDSTVLHYLIDMALPNNRIPRVFINTGIEYNDIVKFVKELANKDDRFIILPPTKAVKEILEKYGYPFKSKQHSHMLSIYQNSGLTGSVKKYLYEKSSRYLCPKKLQYQFTNEFNIKCSEQCCNKLKKDPIRKWEKNTKRNIVLTGMRKDEGGQRESLTDCILTDKNGKLKKFHPLIKVNDQWEEWVIENQNITLCKLYYPPYNFNRTGCKGCPFSLDLQMQLTTMEQLLPNEKKQCEMIWKPIYDEYRRLNYRLNEYENLSLFDFDFKEKNEHE